MGGCDGCGWVGVVGCGWVGVMGVGGCGWVWVGVDGCGCDGCGWVWMGVGVYEWVSGCGWVWVNGWVLVGGCWWVGVGGCGWVGGIVRLPLVWIWVWLSGCLEFCVFVRVFHCESVREFCSLVALYHHLHT